MDEPLIVPCSACRTLNRIPRSRIGDVPVCNQCLERLFGSHPAQLSSNDFERFVTASDLPVLVDFWAPWCGPCIAMEPQFIQASKDLASRALLAKVNSDQHSDLAARFGIRSIPTMVLLDHGSEIARISGAMQSDQIAAWVLGQVSQRARQA